MESVISATFDKRQTIVKANLVTQTQAHVALFSGDLPLDCETNIVQHSRIIIGDGVEHSQQFMIVHEYLTH